MVEITPTSALVGTGIALAGAEAVGVTNISGSASDKQDQSGGDTSSVIDSLLAGVQIGQATGRGGGAGVGNDEPFIPQTPSFDLDLAEQSDGGGFLARDGLLTDGDRTNGLLDGLTDPNNDRDETQDDSNRTPGDASNRWSEYGGDPLGWNSDRVTETAEDESQGFISGVFETGGNMVEGAVAGGTAGAVGGSVIPGAGTLGGAIVGGGIGAVSGIFGDPSDMAVDAGEGAIETGGSVINDVTGGGDSSSGGSSDEPRGVSVSVSDRVEYTDQDGNTKIIDGSPDASSSGGGSDERDIDTSSSSSGGRSLPTGSVDTDGDGSPDASMVSGDEPDVSGGSSSIPGAVDTDGDGQADASMPTDEVDLGGESGSSDKSSSQDSSSSGGGFFSDPVGSIGDTVDDAGDTIGGFL